ncbi:hypothetical protein HOP50_13g71080 [Chloropicon primus]|nr:hypothetical protein HOP50_13g71080 [Chloropicon primus]
MFWRGKRKEESKENADDVDIECGLGGVRPTMIDEIEVQGALDMAQVALASVRRRAEQSEGEAVLLSLQLQDNQAKVEKERERRTKLERDMRERNQKVSQLQKAVADGILNNRRVETELSVERERARTDLRTAKDTIKERDGRIAELEKEKASLGQELSVVREQLEEALSSSTRADVPERSRSKVEDKAAVQEAEKLSDEDVSAAAMTLARTLAREMSGFGREGLRTEASATASAALKLAEALGGNADPAWVDATSSFRADPSSEMDKGNAPATLPLQDKENFNYNAFGHFRDAMSSAKANRACLTSPSKKSHSGLEPQGSLMGRKRGLSTSKASNVNNASSKNASPWPAPLGSTLGQFLSWTSAEKKQLKPRWGGGGDIENNAGESFTSQQQLTQKNVEYSLTSW